MAAYRRVHDSRHLQADCQEPRNHLRNPTLGSRVPATSTCYCVQLAGALLLSVGCWYLADERSTRLGDVTGDDVGVTSLLRSAAVVACVVGGVVLLVGVLGCVAAWREIATCLVVVRHTHSRHFSVGFYRAMPTQPCIPPGSLNRVPASAGVKAGMPPLPGGR